MRFSPRSPILARSAMSLPPRECQPLAPQSRIITPAPWATDVSPDRILLTASTSEAYAFVFKLLADPGDEVLVPSPSYPLFDYLAALDSVRVVQYPLVYQGSGASILTRSPAPSLPARAPSCW